MTQHNASVLLIIGGGIAAYKVLELIRLLKKRTIRVRVIMTASAHHFITPLSIASLTGEKVHTDLFNLTDEIEMGHIELSRSAELLVVAPATADLMAKMAAGLAGDLASTALLATDKPVLLVPAMNVRMWLHPSTQRNVAQLTADGCRLLGPAEGDMACGEFGPGRMVEAAEIAAVISEMLADRPKPLAGRHVLVTAGPTREAIDPVRYISNHSSGKQGYAIAAAAARLGARVSLVSGPVDIASPAGVIRHMVTTAEEMLQTVEQALPADIAIFTAAVADWRVANPVRAKIKKTEAGQPPHLSFTENPDILKTVASLKTGRPALVIGFAAETERIEEHAQAKLATKGCDLIVANDVSPGTDTFGGDRNAVSLITAAGTETWPKLSKQQVAERLMQYAADRLKA